MKLNTFVFILISIFGFQALAKDLGLGEYIQQVQSANPSLRAAQAAAQKSESLIRPSSTWEDPFIAVGVDEIPFDKEEMGSVKRYQVSQAIPFPGKNSARSAIARHQAEAAKSGAETTSKQLKVLATQIYFKTYLSQKAVQLNEDLIKILQSVADSAKAKYRSGSLSHHELLLAQAELAIFEVEKLRLQRDQKSLQAIFNELRNEPGRTLIGELDYQYTEPKIKEDSTDLLNQQPEIKSLTSLVHQSNEEERLAKLSYFPDLVLQGMMMEPSPDMMGERKNWGVMVGVSLPLYFWRKQNDLLDAARFQKQVAEFEKQSLLNRISTERLEAQEQLKTSLDVVKLYKNSVLPATRLALQNARTSYVARSIPLDQYLEVLKVNRNQELEYLASQMDVSLAETRIHELLSNPPLIRLSPGRPSLFSGGMSTMENSIGSGAVNMGSGMSGPARKTKTQSPSQGSGGGMEGM